jgi:hypothetical protein
MWVGAVGMLALGGVAGFAQASGWTVGAGSTLTVAGSVSGDIAVSGSGVLAGAGSVKGNVSVANGGIIAPGNPAGTLSVGNLVLDNASVLNYGLGSSSGLIQVNGNLTLDGAVNVTALSGFGANSYRLLDYTGSLTNNVLTISSLPTGYAATVDTAATGQVNLTVSTSAIDTIPNAFSFTAQTGVARSTPTISNSITVSSINSAANISIANGEYAVSTDNGNTWSGWSATTPSTVGLNNQVKVRQTSSGSFSTLTTATLTIGGVSGAFDVTTQATRPTSYTGPTATGTGNATAIVSGGVVGCGFDAAQFVSPNGNEPTGISFPHGLFNFTLNGCTPGGAVTLNITYPSAIPAGTQYWKYGPTPNNASPHWYTIPSSIAGSTMTFSITDGDTGDDDTTVNGVIVDQGGPGLQAAPTAIPTLSEWGLILLAGMLGVFGVVGVRRGDAA